MMTMRNSTRPAIGSSVIAIALVSASSAFAQVTSTTAPPASSTTAIEAQARANDRSATYLDLSGSVGYSSNPYLEAGGGDGSLFGRVSALAGYTRVSSRTTIDATAYVENQTYANNNGSKQLFDLAGTVRHVVTPRLDVYARGGFSGDVGGQLGNRFTTLPSAPPPLDTTNPLPPIDVLDPNIISLNRRQYRLLGQGGLSYKLTERDFANASVGYQRVIFARSGSQLDYGTVTGSFGWDRVFSARTTAGLRVVAERSDYRAGGESTIISPAITATTQLAQNWTLSGSAGVSFVRNNTLFSSERTTGFSGDVSLCKSGELERLCASLSRSAQASLGQSVVTATSAGVSYFRRMGARDTVQLGGNVSRSTGGNTLLVADKSTYYSLNSSFNRRFSPRLSAGVQGAVRRIERTGTGVPTDVTGTVFLRYRLGDLS